jgi:predicted DNA-binding protein (MmcQ/YjbR family)
MTSAPDDGHDVRVDRDQLLELLTRMPGAVEDYPFGDEVAVFKVGGKMFALVSLDADPAFVTLKCDPARALELRDQFAAVRPGYHTNKRHWNSVDLDDSIDPREVRKMVEHSYDLVVRGLPQRARP